MYHPVSGLKKTYDTLRAQNSVLWETRSDDKIGRLAQGVGTRINSVNENIFFIKRNQVP